MVETGTKKEGFLDRDVGWLAFGRLDAALQRLGVTLHGDTERWREQTEVIRQDQSKEWTLPNWKRLTRSYRRCKASSFRS
ncbi:hypothetical protein I3760_09G170600 [Carya illinoinensis]|nr:hypothetical protein I3760_09G170600 [Carya illinoinensis]